jgi:hypothetical protein
MNFRKIPVAGQGMPDILPAWRQKNCFLTAGSALWRKSAVWIDPWENIDFWGRWYII